MKFEGLAERAAVELGHEGGRSGVVFWLDLLKRDSPNYRVTGSGSGDGGVTRDQHGKIERVCEASADYCIRLETQDLINVSWPTAKSERSLTETQQRRITEAEQELNDSIEAHEKMRQLLEPSEWRQAGPPSQRRTMAGEIPKLQRDIEDCVIKVFGVLAEASWSLGSKKRFGDQLNNDVPNILEWALAKVNPKDLPALDRSAIETMLAQEVSNWILKAQREFPPPWMATAAPHVTPTNAERQDSSLAEPVPGTTEHSRQAAQAAARKAVVMPILKSKEWTRSKWAAKAGVGKNGVYEYLEGKRRLSNDNRRALGLTQQ